MLVAAVEGVQALVSKLQLAQRGLGALLLTCSPKTIIRDILQVSKVTASQLDACFPLSLPPGTALLAVAGSMGIWLCPACLQSPCSPNYIPSEAGLQAGLVPACLPALHQLLTQEFPASSVLQELMVL